ncbi:CMRF35-like molecule 7 isoform X2 [Salminus brasiliensis]|uniref:CMRF35-like molecule 7 isoform X2 n=1 Tax=Salminus brasiliensis TaxID=930266 RepID=UPI003B836160
MQVRIMLHLLSCLLFAIRKEVFAVPEIEGLVNEHLNISCTHGWASTNIKYLCRWNCKNSDMLIRSIGVGKVAQKGRYLLYDRGGGRFTVTIAGLWKSDSGRYWCGVERSGPDTFYEFVLKVLDAPQVTTPPETSPLPNLDAKISTKGRQNYIPACVFAVLLILVVSLMLHHRQENIVSVLQGCSLLTRGQTNTDHLETTPGDQNPDKMSSIYQNMELSVSQSNPVYQMLQIESTQSDLIYDSLVSSASQ